MNFKDQLTYRILKRFSVFTGRLSENRREKLARRLASFIYYLLPITLLTLFYFSLIRKFKYENLN